MKILRRKGVIYRAGDDLRGEISVYRDIPLRTSLRVVGKFLIVVSATITLLTFSPLLAMEFQQEIRNFEQKFNQKPREVVLEENRQTPLPPVEKRFQIIIPKIGVNSPVIANVDPTDAKEYSAALKQGVAHSLGSGLPGEEGSNRTIYLFAHSTNSPENIRRFNAIFYLLKDLEIGDEIIIWFWGKEFKYQVEKKEILEANNTDYFLSQNKEEILVLQTCWPPGTTLKQLVVVAKPKNF